MRVYGPLVVIPPGSVASFSRCRLCVWRDVMCRGGLRFVLCLQFLPLFIQLVCFIVGAVFSSWEFGERENWCMQLLLTQVLLVGQVLFLRMYRVFFCMPVLAHCMV